MTDDRTIPPELLTPYPDELVEEIGHSPVTDEELGWRVLPTDATPAQRARAECVWRPVHPGRPCRCSGPCYHGQPCDEGGCAGRLQHVDRRAAGLLGGVHGWYDEYVCDTCGREPDVEVTLPDLPWGETTSHDDGTLAGVRQFPGVRHCQVG